MYNASKSPQSPRSKSRRLFVAMGLSSHGLEKRQPWLLANTIEFVSPSATLECSVRVCDHDYHVYKNCTASCRPVTTYLTSPTETQVSSF